MRVLCRGSAVETCPKNLNICCYTCEDRKTCDASCVAEVDDYETCNKAEVITGELTQFESAAPEAIQQITNIVVTMKQLEKQEKTLKEQLVKAMETYGVKSFENDHIKMTYVAPTTRSAIDTTRLKKDHPDLVKEYTKVSNVSASVRITVK